MKYKWIELHNYMGFYQGMGLTHIKVDFTKCRSNKIIIRGDNGSGKSTLMEAIDVHPDSNDKFMEKVEARKIICISDRGTDYIIRYIHPILPSGDRGTTKGYISKVINGQMVELNPNGNISSCKDILYDEFMLDANFMALSKLSTEDRGLVDKKPSERKKFVNNIISALETYNNINKTLNKRSSNLNAMMKSITSKINNIGDENLVMLNLQNIETRLTDVTARRNSLMEQIGILKNKMYEINEILNSNNYAETIKEIKVLEKSEAALDNVISSSLAKLNMSGARCDIDNLIVYINERIIKLEMEIQSKEQKIPDLLAKRNAEHITLKEKTEQLQTLQSEYNYIDIKESLRILNAKKAECELVFDKMGHLNISLITREEFDTAMESLFYINESTVNLTSSCSSEDFEHAYYHISDIRKAMIALPAMRRERDELNNQCTNLKMSIMTFDNAKGIISALDNRPSNCKIDDCPYIKSAIETNKQYPEEEYIRLHNEYSEKDSYLKVLCDSIEETEKYSAIVTGIDSIDRELRSKFKLISKLPLNPNFMDTFFERVIYNDQFDDIAKLYPFIDCGNMIEEYKVTCDTLHKFEVESKLYESKNAIIESILKDIEELSNNTNEISNIIDITNTEILNAKGELLSNSTAKSKLESINTMIKVDLKEITDKLNTLRNIESSMSSNIEILSQAQDDLNKLHSLMGSIDAEERQINAERDNLKHSAILIQQYKRELEEYQTDFTRIEKVRYYSAPTTGIQTLFMEIYMNKVVNIANSLLANIFNGEFTILPFIINDSEFRIPCIGNALKHDDISSMSTAQKAMISMIISFSILYNSSTKYNIIKLDEIDGGLDTNSRTNFIRLLEQLMDMLTCEQCFIVSHNTELNAANADVIIMGNKNIHMYNEGNVIWSYNDAA